MVKSVPQRTAPLSQTADRTADGQVRETVHLGAVGLVRFSLRVLVVAVAHLTRPASRQCWHVHPVIVDQPQQQPPAIPPRDQQNVAMLQVGVRDPRLAEPRGQLHPRPNNCSSIRGWSSDWPTNWFSFCPSIHRIFTKGYQTPEIRIPSSR